MLVGKLLKDKRPIEEEAVEGDVACLARDGIALLHAIEAAIANGDVMHVCIFVKTDNLNAILGLLAGHVLHQHITNSGIVASTADFIVLVVKVDLQHRLATLSHLNVFHVDVFDDASTTGVRLDA